MENASKALLMAGGVLLTIIIVSVFVFMYNSAKALPKTQEQVKEAEEIAKFNKPYESYAKNNIRGTDVITLTNMAISNNDTYKGLEDHKIEIILCVIDPIETKLIHYLYNPSEKKVEPTSENLSGSTVQGNYTLTDLEVYENSTFSEILNPKDGSLSGEYVYTEEKDGKGVNPKKVTNWNWNDYWMRSSVASEFKRKKFDCKIAEYHKGGRVKKIEITEHT